MSAPSETLHLTGHAAATAEFTRAASGGRMHHAWLLYGPEGIGKATLAYHIANHVLSDRRQNIGQLNPNDPAYRLIASGAHPDLLVIARPVDEKTGERKSEIPVNEVRKLSQFFRLTSGRGGWRVAIVEDGECLNRNSANALLKILEEPPERGLILMTATGIGHMLPTIRSRCRKLALNPLVDGEMRQVLIRVQPDLDFGEMNRLIQLSGGSVGRALTLLEIDGQRIYQSLLGFLEAAPKLDMPALHAFADGLGKKGERQTYDLIADILGDWLRRLVRLAATGEVQEKMEGEAQLMRRFAACRPLDHWLALGDRVRQMLATGDSGNLDRKLVVINSLAAVAKAMG